MAVIQKWTSSLDRQNQWSLSRTDVWVFFWSFDWIALSLLTLQYSLFSLCFIALPTAISPASLSSSIRYFGPLFPLPHHRKTSFTSDPAAPSHFLYHLSSPLFSQGYPHGSPTTFSCFLACQMHFFKAVWVLTGLPSCCLLAARHSKQLPVILLLVPRPTNGTGAQQGFCRNSVSEYWAKATVFLWDTRWVHLGTRQG